MHHSVDSKNCLKLTALFLCLAWHANTNANSVTLIDAGGFESPSYTTGMLEGQFAKTNTTPTQWLKDPSISSGSAIVQSSVVSTGNQAVRVDRAANTDNRWAVPISGNATGNFVGISWDMRVEASNVIGGFGPLFGIEAYDASGSGLLRLTSLGVDAGTSDVLYSQGGTGFLVESGTRVNFGEWNRFQIILDYTTDTASYLLNGALLTSEGFEQDGDAFTDADITAIAAGIDPISSAATGTAYFDNYRVVTGSTFASVVPEPSSMAFLAAGGLICLRRRPRSLVHH